MVIEKCSDVSFYSVLDVEEVKFFIILKVANFTGNVYDY